MVPFDEVTLQTIYLYGYPLCDQMVLDVILTEWYTLFLISVQQVELNMNKSTKAGQRGFLHY